MNRKTLWIILAILLVTALVVGGVALRSRSRTGKQPDPAEPATGESTAPAEESAPTATAVESPDNSSLPVLPCPPTKAKSTIQGQGVSHG